MKSPTIIGIAIVVLAPAAVAAQPAEALDMPDRPATVSATVGTWGSVAAMVAVPAPSSVTATVADIEDIPIDFDLSDADSTYDLEDDGLGDAISSIGGWFEDELAEEATEPFLGPFTPPVELGPYFRPAASPPAHAMLLRDEAFWPTDGGVDESTVALEHRLYEPLPHLPSEDLSASATGGYAAFAASPTAKKPTVGPGQPPLRASDRLKAATARRRRLTAIARRRAAAQRAAGCSGLWNLPRMDARPFRIGEELGYELSFAGAYVGRFETKVGRPRRVNGRQVLPLFGRARTSGFASSFRPFVGRYMAMAEPQRMVPVGVRVESTYDKDERWERVRFDHGDKAVRADFTLHGRQLRRDYRSSHKVTDLLSMLYLARQIDVKVGLSACQHVFGARRLWKMTANVTGSERLSTPAGRMDAWRVKVNFDRMPTPGLNNKRRPHYDMDIYLAKDDSRTPLAFVVEYKGLTARGDLRHWSLSGKSKDDTWTF